MIDIYILAGERTFEAAQRFMDSWTRGCTPASVDYEFPQYAENPIAVYSTPVELIKTLIREPLESHGIYWNNPAEGSVRTAMLFFTTDGAMIAGLSVEDHQPSILGELLRELAVTVRGSTGYCDFENPPPDTVEEFMDNARNSSPPKLVKGVLMPAP